MLTRNELGKFKPSLIRIADTVICSKSSDLIKITAGKHYKVVGTALSKPKDIDHKAGNICTKRDEFVVVNDIGDRIKMHLKREPNKMLLRPANELFGCWEKL